MCYQSLMAQGLHYGTECMYVAIHGLIHVIVYGEYLELSASVNLVGGFLIFGREGQDEFLVEYLPLRKLGVLFIHTLGHGLGTRLSVALML